ASEGLLTERDISVFLSSALSLFDERRDDTTDEYILPSRSSIEEHPERGFDLDHYAVNANYSKYHFIRRFRKAAGLTPHRFIIQNRIRKAQRLLDDGSRITETAVSVGFYDQSHFDKYFRKIVGISPKEYISSNRRQQGNFLQE
ncbi:MAG: helix-turn-helix transcriptional regulator, partial [Oscillospiraceae bacterium]|nr:helix-turn-helix transcriptional regulator [Oscillospiraceae bacterium]